jgi:hypothetical protein
VRFERWHRETRFEGEEERSRSNALAAALETAKPGPDAEALRLADVCGGESCRCPGFSSLDAGHSPELAMFL